MATGSIKSLTVVDSVVDMWGRVIPFRSGAIKVVIEGMGARHPIDDPLPDGSSIVINIKRPGFDDTFALVAGGKPDVVRGTLGIANTFPPNWTTLSSAANGVLPRSWCSSGSNGNGMYFTEAGGTKGATPPTALTSGASQSDGGVTWRYYDPTTYVIAAALGLPLPPTNNAGTANNVNGDGDVEVYYALDFAILKDDVLVSATAGAGIYISSYNPAGVLGALVVSVSGSIPVLVNSSTLEYGFPVVTQTKLPHQASQGNYYIEYHVADPWGRNFRPVVGMKAQAFKWDGSVSDSAVSVLSTSKSVASPPNSPAGMTIEVFGALVPTTACGAGDAYIEAEFYPWFGNKPFKTKLHGEGRDWVALTDYSGNREVVRNGTGYYSLATAGKSGSTGGPTGTGTAIADGTCVWNYLGSAVLTGQAGTKMLSSNVQARHHFLNDLGTYKRGWCFVNDTGANIGAPAVYGSLATALANKALGSYGSASLALVAIRAYHNTAGGGTTHDDAGGGTAIFLAGTHAGFGASLASSPIGSEWVHGIVDPEAAAGAVQLNAGTFKIAHRRMRLEGFKSVSAGASTINSAEVSGVALLTNELWLEGWDYTGVTATDVASQTSVLTSAAGLVYLRNSVCRTGGRFQVENQRSHYGDLMGTRFEAGVWDIKPRTSTLGIRVVPGSLAYISDPLSSTSLPARMFYSFGRCFITGSQNTTNTLCELLNGVGVPYLGSFFETGIVESVRLDTVTPSNVQPCLRVAADASTADASRVYFQNLTVVGERFNIGYNDGTTTPATPLREYWFIQNCITHTRGMITDYSSHPFSSSQRGNGRYNNWLVRYSVGFRDNVTMTGVGNGINTTTGQQRFGNNEVWGVFAGNDAGIVAQFVNDRSRNAGAGNNTGGGDYHPSIDALATGHATVQSWAYDALGASRAAPNVGSIGALESQFLATKGGLLLMGVG